MFFFPGGKGQVLPYMRLSQVCHSRCTCTFPGGGVDFIFKIEEPPKETIKLNSPLRDYYRNFTGGILFHEMKASDGDRYCLGCSNVGFLHLLIS